jgi:hypothetical protein
MIHEKPIDKLFSMINGDSEEEKSQPSDTKLSNKALSILDSLFGVTLFILMY